MSIIFSIISIITGIIGSQRYGLVNNKAASSAALVCSQGERSGLSDCRLFADRCLHPDGCDIFSPTLSALQLSCSISLEQQTIPNLIPSATSSVLSPVVAAEADSHALGAEGVSSSYGGDRILSLPGTIYSRLLERILWPIELQIQDQVCGFLAVR